MKLIDVGRIRVSPFVFESITEVRIEKSLNDHATLYACGIVKDDKQFTPATGMTEGTGIKCENDGLVYFSGVLQHIKVTCVDAVYRLEVYAISHTILMDTVKHKRSFQDNAQNYQSIVESVIADNGAAVTYNANAMTVENIILQYNETNWEFAKRLASHTNDVLIPITDDNPAFHFGAPSTGGAKVISRDFAISRDFDAIRRFDALSSIEGKKNTSPLKLTDEDVTLYTVETDEYVCDLGEKLNLNGADLHVCHLTLSFVKSALTVVYTLCYKQAISTPKYYNPAITGLILDGTVMEVENDTLKLKLDDDNERGVELDTGEKHFFKYATDYSMENHTGWYVMPEDGDTVQLLFPNEDERYAYATSAVRQDNTERTIDHMVKYWRTSYGREIKMDKDEILISTVDDTTYIRIHKDNGETGESLGIEVITPNRVLVKSGSKINIESDDDMTITTEKNLYIEAKDSIEMVCAGNVMKFIPADGIAVATDKEYQLVSEGNASVDGKSEITVKSGKDMTIDCGAKLAEGASKKIEMASGGSSIMMDSSGVDIKATMIREN
ncbi:MAG: DUF2345 domain-containing protein [Firmicutes bacterium]|nr:DUF2345 domain-containing protein [Bacillota bacterium]